MNGLREGECLLVYLFLSRRAVSDDAGRTTWGGESPTLGSLDDSERLGWRTRVPERVCSMRVKPSFAAVRLLSLLLAA